MRQSDTIRKLRYFSPVIMSCMTMSWQLHECSVSDLMEWDIEWDIRVERTPHIASASASASACDLDFGNQYQLFAVNEW